MSGSMLRVMTGAAAASGLIIAVVYQATAGRIERNRAERLAEAVAAVLPGTVSSRGYVLGTDGLAAADIAQADVIGGHDGAGAFLGVALPVQVMGYQDTIRMLLGYDPARQRLTGFAVLESRETPGLGARIGTDPGFLSSLRGLDLTLVGDALAHPVGLTRPRSERAPWEVDGITGATVSSRAVVQALNAAAPRLAAVRAQLEALTDAG